MNNLNSILLEGNMMKDPLLRSTPKGISICTFSLASNRYFRRETGFEKEVGFFDIETNGKLAEACYDTGKKGRGCRVVGRLKQDRWVDNENKQCSKVFIVAEHVEFRPVSRSTGEYTEEELSDPAVTSEFSPEEEVIDEAVIEEVPREVAVA
ncbi:MAG: single-stranded DNA-binding protein [Treponema sp.]|jgi:single-strand DNA-binding protein|nr:single-stranded DNA-binding protein [Treponema sp.]